MPSSEWGGKDRPVYYRSPSSQMRHQAHANASAPTNAPASAPAPAPGSASADDPASAPANSGTTASAGVTNAPAATVGSAIQNVSATVKPYLPGSIAAYLPTSAAEKDRAACEMPSKEVPSGSKVGVGSLPGTTSETSVAKLPDERAMEHPHHKVHKHHKHGHAKHDAGKAGHAAPAAAAAAAAPSMYQSAKNYIRQSVGAYLPGSGGAHSELPSRETPGGSLVGVGSLPGTTSEVSVAKLPEERRLEGMPSHETDHEVLGKSGGVGALPGGPNESRVALLPEERLHPEYEGDAAAAAGGRMMQREAGVVGSPLKKSIEPEHEHEEHARVPGAVAGFGGTTAHPDVRMDPGYHPAALHPVDPKFQEKERERHQSASYASAAAAGGEASRRSPESGQSSSSSGERKKPGFMKKVKGEVKVISGKLSHNEKKIEEGKQLKGK
ncbi:hypothetical protein C0992_008037 [Termitomyces sp. T32_za158]|nr:hypothetical protein C0992_008037 [Termitomyces sp. T32_za158]